MIKVFFFKTQSKVLINPTANSNIFYSKTFILRLKYALNFLKPYCPAKHPYSTEILPLIRAKAYTFGNTHTSRPATDPL